MGSNDVFNDFAKREDSINMMTIVSGVIEICTYFSYRRDYSNESRDAPIILEISISIHFGQTNINNF